MKGHPNAEDPARSKSRGKNRNTAGIIRNGPFKTRETKAFLTLDMADSESRISVMAPLMAPKEKNTAQISKRLCANLCSIFASAALRWEGKQKAPYRLG